MDKAARVTAAVVAAVVAVVVVVAATAAEAVVVVVNVVLVDRPDATTTCEATRRWYRRSRDAEEEDDMRMKRKIEKKLALALLFSSPPSLTPSCRAYARACVWTRVTLRFTIQTVNLEGKKEKTFDSPLCVKQCGVEQSDTCVGRRDVD